jgi:RHS repeat-associated protein
VAVRVRAGDAILTVSVNGISATRDREGVFVASPLALAEGPATLTVTATDRAGRTSTASIRVVVDRTPPRISVASGGSDLASGASLRRHARLAVTAVDASPVEVTTTLNGKPFASGSEIAEEGNYVLEVEAADRAGNRARKSVSFRVLSRAPEVTRLSPASGAVVAVPSLTVSGECEDAESVTVAGLDASVYGRRFVAGPVPLAPGANTVAIVARDAAGNESRSSLKVVRDDAPPKLAVATATGATTAEGSLVVRGSVEDDNLAEVLVNGARATMSGHNFEARVPLSEGPNRLTVVARDAAGNRTETYLDAVRATEAAPAERPAAVIDAAPLRLVSAEPVDGATELPAELVPRLKFSKPLDKASVTAESVRLLAEPDGAPVPASLFVQGKEVALLPKAALTERASYRLEVGGSVTDTAGKGLLEPRTFRFRTGRSSPPPAPELDRVSAALCSSSVTLTGQSDPGARIRVEGGAELATAAADREGRFAVVVPLAAESVQALSLVASDAQGRASPPVVRSVRRDCTAPRVERIRRDANGVEIVFSEPIDPRSLASDGAVVFTRRPEGVLPAPRAELDRTGRIARFNGDGFAEGRTTVTVGGVTDLAGNSMPAPYVTLAGEATLAAGQAGLSGQVFDDRIGRPLAGAVVTVIFINGVPPTPPAPTATTASDGSFSLVATAGEVVLRASQAGYTPSIRIATPNAGDSITVFDMRLTPETIVTAAANGSASVTDGELALTLPASAVAGSATVRAATLSVQGLAALPPLGWSPAAAVSVEVGAASVDPTATVNFGAPVAASWDNKWGYPSGTTLLLARFDLPTRRYVSAGSATLFSAATKINASITQTGAYVVLVPDPAPNAPPQPSVGQPVTGVAAPGSDPITSAAVTVTPTDVLPTQTADILATLTISSPVPSGYPVEVAVSETLTLLNNQQVQVPSFLEDLTLSRNGAGQAIVPFRVRPSSTAAQVALSVGYENLAVRHYAADLTRGNLIGTGGGTVAGPTGFSVVIPAGALSQTVPVSLTQVNAPDVPVAIPSGYHLVAAIQLSLGGQTLTQPAALKWASATDPTGSGLIWAEVTSLNGISRARFVNPGRYDSVNHLVETTPAAVHNLPVPGVLASDIYLLLGANQATAYVKGRVLDTDGATPVASAVVTEDGTSLVAVSDGTGSYALPVPAAGAVVRSSRLDTGNVGQATVASQTAGSVATKDIPLAVTAPYVVSVAPATSTPLPLDLPVVFTLSEPLNPSTVGAAAVTAAVGSTPISGTARLSPSGVQVTFTPDGTWPGKSNVTLTLSSTVTDLQGYNLVDQTTKAVSNYVVTYGTVDPTPPTDINPLLIGMSVPTGVPPTVTISGTTGAACSACIVIAVNDTTTVTSSTTALSDGSFTLTLAATTTDYVYVIIRRSSGGEIRVDPGPYRDDGGRVAYLGPRAADYITRDGIRVTVDQGAFSLPVTLRVSPIAQADLPAPLPAQSTFIAGISFDPGDVAADKPIDLAVAAPPGVTGGQFLVARAVQVAGQTLWMVIDTAQYQNGAITTRPSGGTGSGLTLGRESGKLILAPGSVVNCPQLQNPGGSKDILDRVTRKSNILILGAQQQLAFVASSIVTPDAAVSFTFGAQYSYLNDILPYVWVAKEASQQCYFALPAPLNVPLTVLGRDATTGLTIFQGNFSAVTDPTNITQLPPGGLSGSPPAPRLIDASPFKAYTFVPAVTGGVDKPFLTNMTYNYTVASGNGTLIVKGLAGAVEASVNLSLTNNIQNIATVAGTAAADGTFTLTIAANPGEDVTFLAGTKLLTANAQIHLLFSQSMDVPSVQQVTLNSGALAYDVLPDNGTRGYTLVPKQPFAAGSTVTLLIPANKIPKALTVLLSSPAGNIVGSRDVKDVNALYLKGGLLLEVTGTAGNLGDAGGVAKLNLYDASDPGAVALCSSLALFDFARGVTMDDHDRVLVAMGGGGTNGRIQVFRLSAPTGTGLCSGRVLLGEGTNPGDLDRPFTQLTVVTGAGDLGVLPEGFPRKIEMVYRETRQPYVVDVDTALPQFVTSIVETPPSGPQTANSPLTVAGQIPGTGVSPSPLNQPASVVNRTTGQMWTAYADAAGNFSIVAKASSGDRLEIRINAGEVSIVGTVGFGIQGVDVNKTVHLFGQDCLGLSANNICPAAKRLLFSFGRLTDLSPPLCRVYDSTGNCSDAITRLDQLNDLALLPAPAATAPGALPTPADPAEDTVFALVNRFGLGTFSLTGDAENVRINQLGAGVLVQTFDTPPIYPNFFAIAASRGFPVKAAGHRQFCTDAMWKDTAGNVYLPTLAFLGSSQGVFVVDVTKASVGGTGSLYPEPAVIGLFRLPSGSAATLSLDATRGLLYVGSDGTSGQISAYDMTDPCTLSLTGRVAPATDPRRIASIDLPNENANTAFVVDGDTGVVFGAGDPTGAGNGKAFAVALSPPPLQFVADTDHNGVWEQVGSIVPLGVPNPKKPAAPYPPDVVRILANIFGHAGTELVVELSSTSSTGVLIADPSVEFPRSRKYVTLRRQSDDPADPGYNRYLSPPIVVIADPRALKNYAILPVEDASQSAGQNNPYACQNCKPDTGYTAELTALGTQPPAANDGSDRAHPIKQAFEIWAGEKLVVRLAETAAVETALKALDTYLTNMDLQRVQAAVKTTRADWTPSLHQAPRVNPSVVGDEAGGGVVLSSGEATLAARDMAIAGRGLDFALDRFYASQGIFFGPLGRNWDSPLFARLRELPTGDVDFYDGTGRRETYQFDPSRQAFVPPPGRFAELYRLPDLTFFLREQDNTQLRFDATGRLTSISDAVRTISSEDNPDGNRLRFFYDGSGRLAQIVDALNHTITLDYYPATAVKGQAGAYPGLIRTFTDPSAREVQYQYDDKGRLITTLLPEISVNGANPFTGATRRKLAYTYIAGPDPLVNLKGAMLQNNNLLTASNARAQEVLHFDYTDAFSIGATEAVSTRKIATVPETFSYTPSTNTTVFTSRRGHQTTIQHDSDGHPLSASLAGNSTGDINSANPLSSIVVNAGVVPAGPFTTGFTYSGQDGLTQTATMPSGLSVSHDYEAVSPTAPDQRQRANVVGLTVAGTGISLRNQFSYQSLVNGVISHTDPTGATTTFNRDPQKGFVTSVALPATVGTDPANPPLPGANIDRDASTGQPQAEADKGGVAKTYTYFDSTYPSYGYVKTVTEQAYSLGTIYQPVSPSVTTFTRDARGNVLSATDPRGTVSNFQVNEGDWVVQATVPSANVTRTFEYDADGNLTKETYTQSPLGTATRTYTYDALGRRMSVTEGGLSATLATTNYAYTSSGELLAVTHPEGEIDLSLYDGRGLLVAQQRRNSDGTTSAMRTLTRDSDGRILDDFDGVNTHTTVVYDSVGRASRITTPLGAEVRVDYDGTSRPIHVTVVDPVSGDILKERRMDYAPNGQVGRLHEILRKTPSDPNPVDVSTQFFYDKGERVTQVTDPLNRVTLRSYDDHGRLYQSQDAYNNVVRIDYDGNGNPVTRHVFEMTPSGTAEAERLEQSGYDTLNRPTSQQDPLGHTTTATYDESGNLLTVTDALGHLTTYGYDERGRRVSMVDAVGNKSGGTPAAHKTQWAWDRSGKQTSMTDAESHATTYAYDSIGRLKTITYADTKTEQRTWNGDGTVATATDPNGSVATFTYGPDDQPASIAYTKGTGVIGLTSESYTYDKLGRLISATSNAGVGGTSHTTARAYDSLDRMLTETEDGQVINRDFDAVGNPIDVIYPGSNRKFLNTFDVLNRVGKIEEDLGGGSKRTIRTLAYFGFNRIASATAPGSNAATYVYDAARRMTTLTATNTSTSTDFLKFTLGWANDNVPIYHQRVLEASKGDVFQHDEDHRLTLATLTQANPTTGNPDLSAAYRQSLTLGAVHERTQDALTLAGTTTTNNTTRNVRYGYTAYGATTRTYDLSGNVTARGTDVFKWDSKNRLAEADLTGGTKLEFGYDALGRRVEKKKTVGANVTTTNWVYDGWNPVQELRGGSIYRESVFGAGLDDVQEYRIFGSPNHDYEIFRDVTGSTAAVVPDSGPTQLFKYLPFGKAALYSGTGGSYNFDLSTTTASSLWQGLELDPDLGWYYARNRWYDPDIGSFASTDPLGYPDSANAYVWGVSGSWGHDPKGLLCDSVNASGIWSWVGRCAADVGGVYGEYAKGILDPRNVGKNVQRAAGGVAGAGKFVGKTVAGAATLVYDYATMSFNDAAADRMVARGDAIGGFVSHPIKTVAGAHAQAFDTILRHEQAGEYFSSGAEAGELGVADTAAISGVAAGTRSLLRLARNGRLFQGLGDATTSPWLADARAGVVSHLEKFREGGSFLVPKSVFERRIAGKALVGRPDGLFLTTRSAMDKLLARTGGKLDAIKQAIGIPADAWNEPLIRVDVGNPLQYNARFPSGLEQGANEYFRWGGYTAGGLPEIVTEQVPAVDTVATPLKVK